MSGVNLKCGFFYFFSVLDLLIQLILISMEKLSSRIIYGYNGTGLNKIFNEKIIRCQLHYFTALTH